MNIVILDGHTLNPGDLSWDALRACGQVTLYDRTPPDQVVARATGAEALITNKVVLSAETLAALPALRYIGVAATGYNCVDVKAAASRGIVVSNVPTYGTDAVAQQVFALLLDLTRGVGLHADAVRAGDWTQSPDFCFWRTPQIELAGKTLGLVGFGRIGRAVARIADAFGMAVLAHGSSTANPPALAHFEWAPLQALFKRSDVVSLHCPLTASNRHLVCADTLALMKPTAFLINTARGLLVDDVALAGALNQGRIAGAGLDVLSVEPPGVDNPLLQARNCRITPHIAWATQEARTRLMAETVLNVKAFQAGAPRNRVN